MSGIPVLELNCWLLSDRQSHVFPVTISATQTIGSFKYEVKKNKHPALDHIPADSLELWKLKVPVVVKPSRSLAERIQALGKLSNFADELDEPTDEVSEIFPQELLQSQLHIIVSVPATATIRPSSINKSKTSTVSHSVLANVVDQVYNKLWGADVEAIFRHLEVESQTFKYIPKDEVDDLQLSKLKWCENVFLVRPEYEDVFALMETWSHDGSGGVSVLGQPGIGKSGYLLYVLFRRLGARLPTAIQMHADHFVVFDSRGASIYSTSRSVPFSKGTWALADSGDTIHQPANAFLDAERSHLWIVQATSPEKSRYKEWSKQHSSREYWMDINNLSELRALGTLLGLDPFDLEQIASHWGCTLRTCLQIARYIRPREYYQDIAATAAKSFAMNPTAYLGLGQQPADVEFLHSIVFVRPAGPSAEDRQMCRKEIASRYLLDIIAKQIVTMDIVHQSTFFTKISSHPWLKSTASHLFLHIRLTSPSAGQPLDCTPLQATSPSLTIPECLNVVPLNRIAGLKQAGHHAEPFYWRPTSNFIFADAIICTTQEIILLQCTVSPHHIIDESAIESIVESLPQGFKQSRQLCLVYAVDDSNRVDSRSKKFEKLMKRFKLLVYTCVYLIGRSWDSDTTSDEGDIQVESQASRKRKCTGA